RHIINRAMARKFFGGQDPVGRQFRGWGSDGPWTTVVGVTADARYHSLDEDPAPQVFHPMTQGPGIGAQVVFEVRGTPAQTTIRDLLVAASPAVSITFTTFDAQISASLARPRLLATLSGFFGALALVLAVIGIYGVISYGVTRRRNEIGIRIALGAAGRRVLAMVVGEAGWLVTGGLVIGLGLTALGTRFVKSFLYGVSPTDPLTLLSAAFLLALAGVGAAMLPAWRAARVDPMEVLREE
ncbi:MAG: FtsX-like permease family protein, partial [Gemmatimonadales bacterium]